MSSTGHCTVFKQCGEGLGDSAMWWRDAAAGECCGTVPLEDASFQVYYKTKNNQTFCPLIWWLLKQCYMWSSWWNSRRWGFRWRQQQSSRWFGTQGDAWTATTNANIGTAGNNRQLRSIRVFSDVKWPELEWVVLCYVCHHCGCTSS